ncbi:MAG: o-succinylbenzoate synthase [Flavobacteriaceae bacterium]|nr:o-succinylbenzoate synthase [Flavobacteriaceae bacterium]
MKASYWFHSYTFKTPAGTSRGTLEVKPAYFIELEFQGLRGRGECGLLPGLSFDDGPDYEQRLTAFCADLSDLSEATWFAWAAQGRIDPDWAWRWRAQPSMVFALEQALLSWADSAAGGPGTRLYQTAFTRSEVGIPINGLLWMGSSCYLHDQSEARLSEGFRCLKMKVGTLDFEAELDLLRHNRSLDPSLELRVDANGAWNGPQALERMASLQAFGLHSIEQPCSPQDRAGLRAAASSGLLPIALDESLIGLQEPSDRDSLLDEVCPQYIVLKPSLLGGIASSEDWIQRAAKRGIKWWITSALEGSLGLSAVAQWASSLPNLEGYQGFGTGSLYRNNLPALTQVRRGELWFL